MCFHYCTCAIFTTEKALDFYLVVFLFDSAFGLPLSYVFAVSLQVGCTFVPYFQLNSYSLVTLFLRYIHSMLPSTERALLNLNLRI
jgi:hypothetical protein